jgi:thymidylate synthase (FAD)
MKIVEPSVEYWPQGAGMEGIWNQIARATRTCYQSSVREGESSKDFVKRVILKPALIEGSLNDLEHCKFNFDKMHGGMLEHGTVYITVPPYIADDKISAKAFTILITNKYSKVNTINNWDYITTNLRVLFEENILDCLKYITEPTEHHVKRYTFSVITDIGVTREMNRHRTFSIAEQSTRYCDLTKDKFGNCLSFPRPSWINKDLLETSEVDNCLLSDMSGDLNSATTEDVNNFKVLNSTEYWDDIDFYIYANLVAQYCYQALRHRGWKPEQARQVLPLGLKTQAVYTAFSDDWNHFLKLRADNISGKAHPNIQLVAKKIKDIIETI